MTYPPALMKAKEAARYLGVSETTLRELGFRRKTLGALRLYPKADLDAFADSLPYEAETGAKECDEIFKVSG